MNAMTDHNVAAVILAAGSGTRMNINTTKQQLLIAGKTVLRRSLEAFENCTDITSITVVIKDGEQDFVKEQTAGITKLYNIVTGGKTRAESARLGFYAIPESADLVAIHDAARCLVTPGDITAVISDAKTYGAATAATAASDTIKIASPDGFVTDTPDRSRVMLAATPQIFKTDVYKTSLAASDPEDLTVTDDNMLVERAGFKVFCTETGKENIKITHAGDVEYAELILRRREK
jgi:2-C-methyl-D-erythritol 4-phosphate cytidylyltransferase